MPNDKSSARTAGIVILAVLGSIGALYFGAEFLIPIAFAFLLNAVFRPLMRVGARFRLPAPASAAIIVLTLFALIVVAGFLLAGPVQNWLKRAPETLAAAESKISKIRRSFQQANEAINKIEDPTGYYNIKNSVTISANPIPVSKPEAAPKAVTGVAIWDDVDPDANRFVIYVAGLSNGWALTDPIPPDTQPVVRRKTLQLNYRRLGDRYDPKSEEIKFVGKDWIYRGAKLTVPGLPGSPKAKDAADKKVGTARPPR